MATTHSKGHGRLETRRLTTTTWLNEYLKDWPSLGQVFRLERTRKQGGKTTVEVVYGITSLSRMAASAEDLLGYSRAHWAIENGLHDVRDETFREDRCRVRRGQSPRVLAALRNVAVHLLRDREAPSLAAATREIAAHPDIALTLLNAPAPTFE